MPTLPLAGRGRTVHQRPYGRDIELPSRKHARYFVSLVLIHRHASCCVLAAQRLPRGGCGYHLGFGLGNTVAVCRKCYVHPSVLEAFMLGALKLSAGNGTATSKQDKNAYVLSHEEASLIDLLRSGAAAQSNAA
ncbi:MAG TPA: hypothetical protein VNM48_04770 [Chloroflexota bacterium]|nr:hypothetical protein [Chloroflexota bacterium]